MKDWHGTSSSAAPLDTSIFNPTIAANIGGLNAYSDQLADVQLSPTLIPSTQNWQKQNTSYGRYPPQFG